MRIIIIIIIIIIAKVPGSSPGGDSQFFLQTFPVCLFPSNQLIIIIIIWKGLGELHIQRISRGSELPEKRKKRQTHQDSNLGPCLS